MTPNKVQNTKRTNIMKKEDIRKERVINLTKDQVDAIEEMFNVKFTLRQGKPIVKDDKRIKQIKKAIKKLEIPTTANIISAVSNKMSATPVRRLLPLYHNVHWNGQPYQHSTAGKPTKIYTLTKGKQCKKKK